MASICALFFRAKALGFARSQAFRGGGVSGAINCPFHFILFPRHTSGTLPTVSPPFFFFSKLSRPFSIPFPPFFRNVGAFGNLPRESGSPHRVLGTITKGAMPSPKEGIWGGGREPPRGFSAPDAAPEPNSPPAMPMSLTLGFSDRNPTNRENVSWM